MKIGDYIYVEDEAYRTPPTATRESMRLGMIAEPNDDELAAIERNKESARGKVKRRVWGVITAIKGDMIGFRNLSNEQAEVCLKEIAQLKALSDIPTGIYEKAFGKRKA